MMYRFLVSICLVLLCGVSAIYEEQLQEFDIQRRGLGFVEHAVAQNKQFFLASAEGVVACVNGVTGRMDWRVQVSSGASIAKLVLHKDKLYAYATDQSLTALSLQGDVVFSIPGRASLHATSFDMIVDDNVYLIADENLTTISPRGKMVHAFTVEDMTLSHFVSNTHVMACRTSVSSVCTSPALLRISQGKVLDTQVLSEQTVSVSPKDLYGVLVHGVVTAFTLQHIDHQVQLTMVSDMSQVMLPSEKDALLVHSRVSEQDIMYCYSNSKCHVVSLQDITSSSLRSFIIDTPFTAYHLFRFPFTRADSNTIGYRDVVVSPTGTVHCSQVTEGPARSLWTKHEELALGRKLITVDAFIEEKDTSGHSVFDFKDRLEMQKKHVIDKLTSFVSHLAALPADLLAYVSSHGAVRKKSPIDESFGFDKQYVLLSSRFPLKSGMKVSGEALTSLGLLLSGVSNLMLEDAEIPIAWSFAPDISPLSRAGSTTLTVELIPSPHHSAPATLIVSAASANSASTLIFKINVHSGVVIESIYLDEHSPIVNILLIHNVPLLVHRNQGVTAVTYDVTNLEGTYVYAVDENDSGSTLLSMQITKLASSCLHPSTKLYETTTVASSYVPGAHSLHTSKQTQTHSPVKILGDSSLLIKYLNPHAVVMISAEGSSALQETEDGISVQAPPTLYVRMYDLVTGQVLYSTAILNAERAVVENIENQYYVSYYNTLYQRTEILSVHFYEGMISSLGPMSPKLPSTYSLFNRPPPIALHKTYILPKSALFMGQTATLHGITNKNLLVGVTSGQVFAVDTRQLDPRRHPGPATPADKEEGLMPLNPLVYLNLVDSISHNTTLFSPQHVHATSTLLESTSVVTVLGVDLFFTRVMPSKAYDMLATDFNKPLLLLIILGMGLAVVILRRMYYKQKLSQGWK